MEGLERISVLAKEIKDPSVKKIVDYLLSRLDMNDKYLNEEKSLGQMIEYIKTEAKKKATNGIAMIDDEEVYGWAVHYFDESNEKLKIETNSKRKKEVEEIRNELPIKKRETKKSKNWVSEGQLTLFDL